MFVIDQMNDALQWLQNVIENEGIGEGCCNDILTLAWLRQIESSQQLMQGGVPRTKATDYTSIRDADSARSCLVELSVELHDRLRHYQDTVKNKDWAGRLEYLQSIKTEEFAEDDDAIEEAKF